MVMVRKYNTDAVKIIGTAVFFYLSGQLAVLPLAVPPSNEGAIWPPAGIALAAVVFWGYRILTGIFLRQFLINFEAYELSTSIASASTIFWFCLQAFTIASIFVPTGH